MFLLLKKLVKKVNDDSKLYFTLKLQEYDELVKEREEKLKNTKVEEKETNKGNNELQTHQNIVVLNQEMPKYQIENLFKISKEIDNKFNLDEEKIIASFIKKHPDKPNNDKTQELKQYLNNIDKYKLTIKNEQYINEVVNKLKHIAPQLIDDFFKQNDNEDIFNLINYLNVYVQKHDTTIYIEVCEKKINYNYLSPRVKTVYNPQIAKGIIIIYQNKKYDYSLN